MSIFKEHVAERKEGTKGNAIIEHIVEESLFGGQNKLFAKVTLKPGSAIDFHKHEGNNETYYVIQGEGTYNDNGKRTVVVKTGETTFCPDGESHGFENTGKEDLVFIALIANSPKN